ncbi:MAG: hypothetical protein KDA93_03660 [Planctomycetaceae bacterium]|nr:hypothetical protein [Planctomycetaceae bacterium]
MSRSLGLVLSLVLCVTASIFAADQPIRTWFDVTGKHSMKAAYVSHDDETVTLKDREGKEFEIKLDQLSETDRKYVERIGTIEPDMPNDPDKPIVIGQSTKRGEELSLRPPDSGWTFTPKAESGLDFTPREFEIPLGQFTENMTHFVISPSGHFGVITTSIPVNQTRVFVVDLSKKRVIATSGAAGDYLAIAVSDDGQRVAIRADEFSNKRQIGVFRVSGKQLKPEGNFTPFITQADAEVQWASFVGENQLAMLCEDAGITVWNLSIFEEDYYFALDDDAAATASADGNVIAFVDREQVGLLNVTERTFQALQSVPDGLWTKKIDFSPSEARLVAFGVNRVVVWETATGAVESDLPDLQVFSNKAECVQENYVLMNDSYLVDLDNQLKLWNYQGTHETCSVGGTTFFAIERRDRGNAKVAFVPLSLPDDEAQRGLEEALAQPDTFLLKPGGTARLDVSKIPEANREQVREHLIARLDENQITVADDAVATVVASISDPQSVSATYYSRKDRVPHQYNLKIITSTVDLVHNGKAVWSRRANNQPASVFPEEGVSVQEELNRQTQKPNLSFFEHIRLPRLIQKEQETEGPGRQQTFGVTNVK